MTSLWNIDIMHSTFGLGLMLVPKLCTLGHGANAGSEANKSLSRKIGDMLVSMSLLWEKKWKFDVNKSFDWVKCLEIFSFKQNYICIIKDIIDRYLMRQPIIIDSKPDFALNVLNITSIMASWVLPWSCWTAVLQYSKTLIPWIIST